MTRHRTSSVGNLNVGDNSGPGLATMPVGPNQARASANRQRALSGVSRGGAPVPRAHGLRRLWFAYREMSYRNTWITPLAVLVLFYTWFALSPDKTENSFLHKFLCLSYPVPGTNPVQYGKGPRDFAFVAFHMLAFTFFREFCMQVILSPCRILAQPRLIAAEPRVVRWT